MMHLIQTLDQARLLLTVGSGELIKLNTDTRFIFRFFRLFLVEFMSALKSSSSTIDMRGISKMDTGLVVSGSAETSSLSSDAISSDISMLDVSFESGCRASCSTLDATSCTNDSVISTAESSVSTTCGSGVLSDKSTPSTSTSSINPLLPQSHLSHPTLKAL